MALNEMPAVQQAAARRSINIALLGATGSIGKSTLEVIALHPEYRVFALTANQNVELMLAQCLRFAPRFAVMVDEEAAERLAQLLRKVDLLVGRLAGPCAEVELPEAEAALLRSLRRDLRRMARQV